MEQEEKGNFGEPLLLRAIQTIIIFYIQVFFYENLYDHIILRKCLSLAQTVYKTKFWLKKQSGFQNIIY